MGTRLNGTLKTIITGLLSLLLVFILVKVVLWNLYETNVFDYLVNDSEKLKFTYSDTYKTYTGVLDQKYDATVKTPTKFNFNGYLELTEKQAATWKSNGQSSQILLSYTVKPDFKSDYEYIISFYEITSSTSSKTLKGSITIDPDTLKLVKDNTDSQNGENYLSTYNDRIQKLVTSANTAFGADIR